MTLRPLPFDESFKAIVEGLPAAVYTTDADGRITYFNEAAAELWGHRPTVGKDLWCGSWRLYWPDGSPMRHDQCPMAVTLRTGKPTRGAEAVAERPDGTRFTFVPYPTPLFDSQGTLIGAVNTLINLSERKRSEEATHRLAAIVESSDDAIISKTLDGVIMSWNEGARRLFGYEAEEIVGQSILTLIPTERRNEEDEIIGKLRKGERVDHYETMRRRKDGSLVHVSLTVSPIRRSDGVIVGASKIARDISYRKHAEALLHEQAQRLATLNRVARTISRDLDLDRIVQEVTDIATDLTGAKFGAFFYNVTSADGESYQLFSLSGAPRSAFEQFGMPRATAVFKSTFDGEGVVRSEDIRRDPRYGRNAPHHGMPQGHLPVVSYLAVPVVSSSGEVFGGLFVGHDEAGKFGPDTETLISAVAAQAAVAMENARLHRSVKLEVEHRRRAEEAKGLLLAEIKHRVKNTLATVQAMASQSFRGSRPEERQAFISRIHALSRAHDLLTQQGGDFVSLRSIVGHALEPFLAADQPRASLNGPDGQLPPNKAVLLALVLHELATNAVKYGSLSRDEGRVSVDWSLEDAPRRLLSLRWHESGGPRVAPPTSRGFGSRMIERAVHGEKGVAHFEFSETGVEFTLTLPV
jgi:PAS domain S-box-containing protein